MAAFWASLIFVVLAEIGDKTQLLAMAFATRYKATTVLWGVFVATALNHLLGVAVGNYLTAFVPPRQQGWPPDFSGPSPVILRRGRLACLLGGKWVNGLDLRGLREGSFLPLTHRIPMSCTLNSDPECLKIIDTFHTAQEDDFSLT